MERTILAVILMVVMFVRFSSSVHGQSETTATPPEVKKTVDAFRGYWVLTGTETEPGPQPPRQVKLTIDCKPTALGAAVSCSFASCCGTPLFIRDEVSSEWIDVTVASLDDPKTFHPEVAIWTEDKLPWVKLDPSRRAFRRSRDENA